MNPALVIRAEATQATLIKFLGVPFEYGKADCSRLAAFHLAALGYELRLTRFGPYRSLRGGKAALKRAGFDSLGEVLDGCGLISIAPAEALTGDLMQTEGDYFTAALVLCVGNGRIFGFQNGTGTVMQPLSPLARAWRA